jgi:membrane-associated phospholipid phosphatase
MSVDQSVQKSATQAPRRALLRPEPGYRSVDYLTQGYAALVALLVLFFHDSSVPVWPLVVAGHLLAILGVHALIRIADRAESGFVHLLRSFYPMILYTFFYTETHRLDGMFFSGGLDGFFIDLDQALFGQQLARTLMQRWPQTWVSEVFYLFYFSYYTMVLAVGLGLYFRRRREYYPYIFTISFVFYICYLTYIFVPVMGPHGADSGIVFHGALASVGPRAVPATVRSGFFYKLMGVIYEVAEPEGGAAFPSSHVAVALGTLWFTWRYLKRARWLHALAVVMLCTSTVYCGYHYAVDVFGGLAAAAVLVPVGEAIHRRWHRPLLDAKP